LLALLGLLTLLILSGLLSLLPLLLTLLPLFSRFHLATQGLKIVSQLPGAIERFFQAFALGAFLRAAFRRLELFQDVFQIALDYPFAFASLIEPSVGDHLLVLPDAIGDSILANRAGRLAKLVACLLSFLPHPSGGLLDVAFETCYLIRKRLFALADLLFLIFARAGLPASRQFLDASRDLLLSFQRLFSLLAKLLYILLSARALRGLEHPSSLLHPIEGPELLCSRLAPTLLRRRL
jgi:hypothetical protein